LDSDAAPDHAPDSSPLSEFYSNPDYEFDFGSDLEEPESEDDSIELPLSGPASGLVIKSTPAGRYIYWPDRKPADLAKLRRLHRLATVPGGNTTSPG
jgi:hypothetical protein